METQRLGQASHRLLNVLWRLKGEGEAHARDCRAWKPRSVGKDKVKVGGGG